jgi:hypothetical protein
MKPEKNRKQDVIEDLFKKKCHDSWSRSKLINYLQSFYGYTYETSVTYYEDMMKFLKENVQVDYETDLAEAVEFLEHNISIEENSFIRLQWKKELNKIKGLHIQKVQVDGQINNIHTIKLTQVLTTPTSTPIDAPFTTEQLSEPKPETKLLNEYPPITPDYIEEATE